MFDPQTLKQWVDEGRSRALEMVVDLTDGQVQVPWLPTINPMLWELCHASYFYETFFLRDGAGQLPVRSDVDDLFDSMNIGHETRWRLPMPERAECLAYVDEIRDRVFAVVDNGLDENLSYLLAYCVFHRGMHNEAQTYTRQTLGYPAPDFSSTTAVPGAAESTPKTQALGDAEVAGGTFALGAANDGTFCFDNEKWEHEVEVQPFAIARAAVTEGEFREFVADGGYTQRENWSQEGWAWRQAVGAIHPLYWRTAGSDFERRHFENWVPLSDRRALIHVCWYEAEAWCRWAKRRLPTEAEWEMAAASNGNGPKRIHPWGDEPPSAALCNLDWRAMGPIGVDACAASDSAAGCRQMTGNVWEWTQTTFAPYPGFAADMYSDYSQTSFHTRKVLRGGCWATPSFMMRNTWRNFYQPARRDIFGGFRTCRL